jgi:hypothetical protein
MSSDDTSGFEIHRNDDGSPYAMIISSPMKSDGPVLAIGRGLRPKALHPDRLLRRVSGYEQ